MEYHRPFHFFWFWICWDIWAICSETIVTSIWEARVETLSSRQQNKMCMKGSVHPLLWLTATSTPLVTAFKAHKSWMHFDRNIPSLKDQCSAERALTLLLLSLSAAEKAKFQAAQIRLVLWSKPSLPRDYHKKRLDVFFLRINRTVWERRPTTFTVSCPILLYSKDLFTA